MALAVPALGALAADPLYSVVDTAFVGHLGAAPLGALAIGTAAFTASFWIFSFLAYGVTPRVARAFGRGDMASAARVGVEATLLALGIGAVLTVLGVAFAGPVVRALGAGGRVADLAEPYLRIRILGAAAVLFAQVGHGWLRGAQDTRTPMFIAGAGVLVNIVLDYVLIFPAGLGVRGAAWATVIGQTGVAVAFALVLLPRWRGTGWRPHSDTMRGLLVTGGDLAVRTGALLAALTVATSVAARMGVVALASWQIAMQIFLLLSYTLDSVAIAGQALIGKQLGSGDTQRARALAARLMTWGMAAGCLLLIAVLALRVPIAGVFTDDARVSAATTGLLVWLALVQPLSGAAFTLDGILMGASDTRYLAKAMVACSIVFIAVALLALNLEWGTAGLAAGATAWLGARTGSLGVRLRSERWTLQG